MKRSNQKVHYRHSIVYPLTTFLFIVIITLGLVAVRNTNIISKVSVYSHSQSKIDEPLNLPNSNQQAISKAQQVQQKQTSTLQQPDYSIPPVTNGIAPILDAIPTKEKVVFLGIDDGANKQSFELKMMQDNDIKATLFLADIFIENNPSFFKPFVAEGSLIEDHTINHLPMNTLSYAQQKEEICNEADLFQKYYGRRPILFRPPGGSYNLDTQRAAADCGMKAVILWVAKANGGSMQYQIGNSLRPGDIVLMHFRPEFKSDMQAFLDAEHAAGLHTELLETWLQ